MRKWIFLLVALILLIQSAWALNATIQNKSHSVKAPLPVRLLSLFQDDNLHFTSAPLPVKIFSFQKNQPHSLKSPYPVKIIFLIETNKLHLSKSPYYLILVNRTLSQFNISLLTDWNLVSIYLVPPSTDITNILASINGSYTKVMTYNASDNLDPWKSYDPSLPGFSDLKNLDEKVGFWIKMNQNDTLLIEGLPPNATEISLLEGWNLVGYPSTIKPVDTALASINNSYTKVMMYNISDTPDPWKSYDPLLPGFSDLKNMFSGFGYWIKMNQSDSWII